MRRDDARIAGRDDALRRQPVQAAADGPLGQAGVADQRGDGRERARAIGSGVVGQSHENELARATCRAAAVSGKQLEFVLGQELRDGVRAERGAQV